MTADYRTEIFVKKLTSAKKHLKHGTLNDIVSIKYRDNSSYTHYQHFIHEYIIHELDLDAKQLDGDFQGQAWLVSDKYGNRIILVEHETGLEILYIVGSMASLVGLIPMICAGWKHVRGRFRHGPHDRWEVEIRRLNAENTLIEQQIDSIEAHIMSTQAEQAGLLTDRIDKLEKEMRSLKKTIGKKSSSKK